jgi:trk system potassium uptake protein TrkH
MLLIAVGSVLLMLPVSSEGLPIGFVDALFTATSAACVTGLAVMDTGTALTGFGQAVILLLIQVGGLGIMTISTLFLLLAGKRMGLMERIVIQDSFTHRRDLGPKDIIKEVFMFALIIEAAGALLLLVPFSGYMDFSRALYFSIFHSISAFCNAGFCLFPDSLVRYQEDWFLNLIICGLIILGGVGFLTLSELRRNYPLSRRNWSRLSLHTRLVLSTTGILLAVSTGMFLLMEWNNTLAPLSVPGRFLAAFFQAVTTRTAGFNTLPIAQMANQTLFLFILLMFIGASPGSCAGGVKTTTISALVILGISRIRGHAHPRIFHRTIPNDSIWKATGVIMISGFIVTAALLLLLISELGNVPHLDSRGKFLELFFEVVSAFGTVGLSADVTPGLSRIGRLIITIVMFIGRLGPLVIGIAISRQRQSHFYYAEEGIMIG